MSELSLSSPSHPRKHDLVQNCLKLAAILLHWVLEYWDDRDILLGLILNNTEAELCVAARETSRVVKQER